MIKSESWNTSDTTLRRVLILLRVWPCVLPEGWFLPLRRLSMNPFSSGGCTFGMPATFCN